MFAKSEIPIKINWATRLTILRIVIAPAIAITLIRGDAGISLLLFCIAAFSDGIDGFIARAFNQRTLLGSILDPLADKLILVTCFAILPFLKGYPITLNYWVSVIVIFRDIIIVIGAAVLYIYTEKIYSKPTYIGKITTFFQFFTIVEILLGNYFMLMGFKNNIFVTVQNILAAITIIVTIVSGWNYISYGAKILLAHNVHINGKSK